MYIYGVKYTLVNKVYEYVYMCVRINGLTYCGDYFLFSFIVLFFLIYSSSIDVIKVILSPFIKILPRDSLLLISSFPVSLFTGT